MSNKKYISQVLLFFFSGIVIPIIPVMFARYSPITFMQNSIHFEYLWIAIVVANFCLEVIFAALFQRMKKFYLFILQVLFYYCFWISVGIFLSLFNDRDIRKILLSMYGFSIIIIMICFIVGLCSKNIRLIKRKEAILGTCISMLIIIYMVIVKSYSFILTLAFLFIIILCCYYSAKQLNDLKQKSIPHSRLDRWSNIIDTAMDIGITFITLYFAIIALIFHKDDE